LRDRRAGESARTTFEAKAETAMRDDFDAIPDAAIDREDGGSLLARIYHDIGLAAVAEALNLQAADFEPEMVRSLERGEYYLVPIGPELAQPKMAI
jgi:hypothetical protein